MNPTTISLAGSVDIMTLLPILNSALNHARRAGSGYRLELDCRTVDDFTSLALAQIVQAKGDLRRHGGEIALTCCSDRIRSRMIHPLFEQLCT